MSSAGTPGARDCEHVLLYEHLAEDFRSFMTASNDDLADEDLSEHRAHDGKPCQMGLATLSTEARGAIRRIYARDFEQFGFSAALEERNGRTQADRLRGQVWEEDLVAAPLRVHRTGSPATMCQATTNFASMCTEP